MSTTSRNLSAITAILASLLLTGCYYRSEEYKAASRANLAGKEYSIQQAEVNTLRARREYFVQIGDSTAAAREGALLAKQEERTAASKRNYDAAIARLRQLQNE